MMEKEKSKLMIPMDIFPSITERGISYSVWVGDEECGTGFCPYRNLVDDFFDMHTVYTSNPYLSESSEEEVLEVIENMEEFLNYLKNSFEVLKNNRPTK
jgi:hypothetical protein